MGPHRVEIPQPGDSPAGLTGGQIRQHLLYRRLAVAIGIDRLDGCPLPNRHGFGQAVNGATAAEYQGAAAMGLHGFEQVAGAAEVHIPVAQRIAHRFAHGLEAGEVDHRLNGLA